MAKKSRRGDFGKPHVSSGMLGQPALRSSSKSGKAMTLSQISTALHAASAVIFSLCAANAAIVGSLLGSWQNARATGGAGICSPPIWINALIYL
jgi:hypothetical protein